MNKKQKKKESVGRQGTASVQEVKGEARPLKLKNDSDRISHRFLNIILGC